MNKISSIILLSIIIVLSSCTSTEETSRDNNPSLVQMQQWQEQEQKRQEAGERSGLSQDEMKALDEYARQKAKLVCRLIELERSSSEALSETAQAELKEMVIDVDDQLTELSKEIDQYCTTDPRKKYFHHTHKHYVEECE